MRATEYISFCVFDVSEYGSCNEINDNIVGQFNITNKVDNCNYHANMLMENPTFYSRL